MARIEGSSNTGHIEDARSLATGSLQSLSKQPVICDMVDSGCNGEFMNNAFASAENVMCTNTGYSGTVYCHASRNCGQACLDDDVYISCDSVVGTGKVL